MDRRTLGGLTPGSTSQNCCQCPCTHSEPQPPPTSAGDPPTLAASMDPWLLLEENCPVDLTDQRLSYKQFQVTGPAGMRRIYLQYKLHYSTVSLHLPGRWEYWDSRRLSNGVLSLLKCNDAMNLMECWPPLIHCFLHPSANSILSDAVSFPGWGHQDLQCRLVKGFWCSSQVSGLCFWGGRANFRTLVHKRPPRST